MSILNNPETAPVKKIIVEPVVVAPVLTVRLECTVQADDHYDKVALITATDPLSEDLAYWVKKGFNVSAILSIDGKDSVHKQCSANEAKTILDNPLTLYRRMNRSNKEIRHQYVRGRTPEVMVEPEVKR